MKFVSRLAKLLQIGEGLINPQDEVVRFEPMPEQGFWYIVKRCRDFSGTDLRYTVVLWSLLEQMPSEDVWAFAQTLFALRERLNTWDMWAACHIVSPTPGADFKAFQNFVLSRGPEYFSAALEDPDRLAGAPLPHGMTRYKFAAFSETPFEVLFETPDNAEKNPRLFAEIKRDRGDTNFSLMGERWPISQAGLAFRFPALTSEAEFFRAFTADEPQVTTDGGDIGDHKLH